MEKPGQFFFTTKNKLNWAEQLGFNFGVWRNWITMDYIKAGKSLTNEVQSLPSSHWAYTTRVKTEKTVVPGATASTFPTCPHIYSSSKWQLSHFLLPFPVQTCSQKHRPNLCRSCTLKPHHSHWPWGLRAQELTI